MTTPRWSGLERRWASRRPLTKEVERATVVAGRPLFGGEHCGVGAAVW